MKQLVFWGILCMLMESVIAQPKPVIVFNQHKQSPRYGWLEVKNLPKDLLQKLATMNTRPHWKSVFPVYTGGQPPTDPDKPSIIGEYLVRKQVLCFKPRFFWVDDLEYYGELRLEKLFTLVHQKNGYSEKKISVSFRLKPVQTLPTYITRVYPLSEKLPANILKMYIYFSAPMSRRQSKKYIKIVNNRGEAVPGVFLPIKEELWNYNRTRLTLFFDPGRIKRGLRPHQEKGTPLQPYQKYRLVIDKNWKDAHGKILKAGIVKGFQTLPEDRKQPQPSQWQIKTPNLGTQRALTIQTGQTLDHALVQRYLQIKNSQGQAVEGTFSLTRHDQQIDFVPRKAWQPGKHTLWVDARLEDLAGNNIRQLFDVDMQAQNNKSATEKVIQLTFNIAKSTHN